MAKEIVYEVPPPVDKEAEREWQQLLETLHESGALRVLIGFVGRLGPVSDIALARLDTREGKNAISTLLGVAELTTKVDRERLQALSEGVKSGARAAQDALRDEAPSVLQLLRMLHHKDTRRSLGAILTLLQTLGAALRTNSEPKASALDDISKAKRLRGPSA